MAPAPTFGPYLRLDWALGFYGGLIGSRACFGFEKLRTVGHHHRHYHCPHTSSFCGDGIQVVVMEIIIITLSRQPHRV
jgi:hypothetical protein